MNFKNILLSICLLISAFSFSQKQHTKSFGFVNDNDVYISHTQDQYFTNGMALEYRVLAKKTVKKVYKKIYTFAVRQDMYSPFIANVPVKADQDRPFAGHLFGSYAITKYFKNQRIFKITYQLGVLGPGSGGEDVQKWYHSWLGLPPINGWEFQIQNQLSANVNVFYLKNLAYSGARNFDFNAFAEAKVGTVFNEIGFGFVSRVSLKSLNPIFNTILFNSNLNDAKTDDAINEFYFYVKPQLTYVAYNATIQGSLFNNDSPLTFKSEPIKANLQAGLKWATKRFNFGYFTSWVTKSVDNGRVTAHKYGTISMAYKFD
ncbi:MAG: lipid A deacylase LpxR family protein [Flavobacteriaceae bacterium]